MKKVSVMLMGLFLLSCTESGLNHDSGSSENEHENHHQTSQQCLDKSLFDYQVWKSATGEKIQIYTENDSIYLTLGDKVGLLDDDSIIWVWSHDGDRESFSYECECDRCKITLGKRNLSVTPSDAAFESITIPLYPLDLEDEWIGEYFNPNNFADSVVEITSSKVIYHLSYTSYVALDVMESLGNGEFLVSNSSSLNTNFPFNQDQNKWFSVIRLHKTTNQECSVCHSNHATHLEFSLSDHWYRYPYQARNNSEFSNTESLVSINFNDCHITPPSPHYDIEGRWHSEDGGWVISFTHPTITPYDSRELNYLGLVEGTTTPGNSDDVDYHLFTYGKVDKCYADPTRYNNVYTHVIAVKQVLEDSAIIMHSLDTEGLFGGYDLTLATTETSLYKTPEDLSCVQDSPCTLAHAELAQIDCTRTIENQCVAKKCMSGYYLTQTDTCEPYDYNHCGEANHSCASEQIDHADEVACIEGECRAISCVLGYDVKEGVCQTTSCVDPFVWNGEACVEKCEEEQFKCDLNHLYYCKKGLWESLDDCTENEQCSKEIGKCIPNVSEYESELLGKVVLDHVDHILTVTNLDDSVWLSAELYDNDTTVNTTSYYVDYTIKIVDGVGAYSSCRKNEFSKIRVYHYPEGMESDPRPYIYIMYPRNIACFEKQEEASEASFSFAKRMGAYYLKE